MSHTGENPFKIVSEPRVSAVSGELVQGINPTADFIQLVEEMVGSAEVFLFIKGTPHQPLCGFSANTLAILDAMGISYRTFDVLSDEGVRAAAKEYAGWPTFPQVYVDGEFIGGNDIVSEMAELGELDELIKGRKT